MLWTTEASEENGRISRRTGLSYEVFLQRAQGMQYSIFIAGLMITSRCFDNVEFYAYESIEVEDVKRTVRLATPWPMERLF